MKVFKIVSAILLVIGLIIMLATCSKEQRKEAGENHQPSTVLLPDQFDSIYTLKKGSPSIRVNIPLGYTCFCSSGGTKEKPKRYYHQDQNEEPEVWGDGSDNHGGSGAYFDLYFLEKEITIFCTFKKEKNG